MTTITEFMRLYERAIRFRQAVEVNRHPGYSEAHTLMDGTTHEYRFIGVKSPSQLEDELLTLFVWLWSMKDHLKDLCHSRGIDPRAIENIVNEEDSLAVVADIANRSKHGALRESRSGRFARLANVTISIPQSAIASISVEAFAISVDVNIPEEATVNATIEFGSGDASIDAFIIAQDALHIWESRAFPLVGVYPSIERTTASVGRSY